MDLWMMHEPNERGEPIPCAVCGEEHIDCDENLLMTMSMSAYHNAKRYLSEEGIQALNMLDSAMAALGVMDVFEQTANLDGLAPEEVEAIEVYFARKTLIDHARVWLYEQGEEA